MYDSRDEISVGLVATGAKAEITTGSDRNEEKSELRDEYKGL